MAEQKTITVKLISVQRNTDIQKQGGGSYKGTLVVYIGKDGQVKQKGIANQAFAYNRDLDADLNAVGPNDIVDITYEKNGNFTNYVRVVKSTASPAPAAAQPEAPEAPEAKTPKGLDYVDPRETPEEREVRTRHIRREACVNSALKYVEILFNGGAVDHPYDLDAVLGFAERIEDFVTQEHTEVYQEPDVELPD